jgi:putative addiction module component (TIGR02574 family)
LEISTGAAMGSRGLDKLRNEALGLTATERAELAHDLVASLDGPGEAGVAEAWDVEVLRRLEQIESGTATLVDREEFTRRMRERLTRP